MNNPNKHYTDQNGKTYFSFQNQGGDLRGKINAEKFINHIPTSGTLLDFGCGNGSLLDTLPATKKIGIEINPIARAEAEIYGFPVYADLSFVRNDEVDTIISNHALEHVKCPYDILSNLYQKLKPGGKLVFCLPIDDWRTQNYINTSDINHHLYTWSPLLFGNLLADVGFQVNQIYVLTHAWPPMNWQFWAKNTPKFVFDLVCKFTSIKLKRRQIIAIATK